MDERPAGASDPLARVSRAVHDRGVEQHSTDGSGPIERAGRQPDPSRIGDGQGQPHGIDDQGRAGVDHGETPSQGHGAGPCVRGSAGERASGIGAQPGLTGMRWAAWYAAHNDAGTAALLAAMEQAGVRRLVMASSVAVYGEGRYRGVRSGPFFPGVRRRTDLDRGLFDHRAPRTGEVLTWEPVREDAPLRPRSAYAASKVAQEHYALAWAASTGSAATVLRYHHVYGEAADSGRLLRSAESGIVARFRADLRAERAPRVFEDGGQVRDFVHVRDVAAATVAAVAHPVAGFVPLNIGSGRPVTLWEVASTMAKAVGGPTPVVTGQYRLTDVRHLVAHHERARHILDFAARIAPAQGLAAYAAAGGRTE
ncbi:NAD-dependent epimerase/dehydratase family protein [Nocardia huaxiensis]|uniref:NAD-dependent epimerase/dehydratase family protein n=1 Tax=Nocardia huaxiensis TaxID=2755382 RepID=UPI0030B809E5